MKRPIVQALLLVVAALVLALTANALAPRQRKLALVGWYPNATTVAPPASVVVAAPGRQPVAPVAPAPAPPTTTTAEAAVATHTLTFRQALQRAVEVNNSVERARADISVAEATKQQLLSNVLPRISATGNAIRNSEEVSFGS